MRHDQHLRDSGLGTVITITNTTHGGEREVERVNKTILESKRSWVSSMNRTVDETLHEGNHENL